MRARFVSLAAVCMAVVFVAGQALAGEKKEKPPKAPKAKPVTGTVAVTKEKAKDDKGVETEVIKSITITSGKKDAPEVFCVVLDDNGKKVADFDGKRVKATGTVEEKDGNKWLTVQSCEEVVKKPKNK
ncbi:MAG: hypothetical protein FJ291_34250 [Planctomycetes bacterium]|nr:hypothetical protein [Planctomycetota bacterium]